MSTPPSAKDIETIGLVGSGAMGRGIAESCLRSDLKVLLYDTSGEALQAAHKHVEAALQRSVDKKVATAQEAETWLSALRNLSRRMRPA